MDNAMLRCQILLNVSQLHVAQSALDSGWANAYPLGYLIYSQARIGVFLPDQILGLTDVVSMRTELATAIGTLVQLDAISDTISLSSVRATCRAFFYS